MSCESVEELFTRICKRFAEIYVELRSAGLNDKDLTPIFERFQYWSQIQERYPTIKPTVLVGPMGAGKSTLINCLTDEPGVAIESNTPGRGTCVPHRHMGPKYDQPHKFLVNAMYISDDQIKDLVEALCQPIHNWLKILNKDGEDGEFEEDEGDTLDTPCRESILTTKTLLCDEYDFASEERIKEFFTTQYEESKDEDDKLKEAREILYEKVIEFKRSRNLEDDVEEATASKSERLLDELHKMSKPERNLSSPHPWPLLREVQIRQRNRHLAAGMNLVDTPGGNDKTPL